MLLHKVGGHDGSPFVPATNFRPDSARDCRNDAKKRQAASVYGRFHRIEHGPAIHQISKLERMVKARQGCEKLLRQISDIVRRRAKGVRVIATTTFSISDCKYASVTTPTITPPNSIMSGISASLMPFHSELSAYYITATSQGHNT